MKTLTFLFSISLFLAKATFAQAPDTVWTKVYDGEASYSVQQTSDEGFILAGYTSSFNSHALLIKTNASGDTLWTKTYNESEVSDFRSVKQTNDGGFIAAGATYSWSGDIQLVRTDSLGEVIWSKTYGGSRVDWASDVKQTFDGGYVIAGSTGSFAFPNGNLWLLKTDSSGDTLWTKLFGGETSYHVGRSVTQTSDSGYIITGHTAFNGGSIDVWLIKTNSSGDVIWMKTYGGSGWDEGNCVQQTNDNGYIIVGQTESSGSGNLDLWLIKTDSNGDTIWTKTYGGLDLDEGNSVQQTNDDGYIIAGKTEPYGPGNSELWIIKTDSNGDTIWTQTFGGIDSDEGYSVQQITDYGYIVSGSTISNGSFGKHVWLLKLSSDLSDVKEMSNSYPQGFVVNQNYPNPFNPSTTIKFALPVESRVKINVYNTIGQLVETLLDKEMQSGYHEVNFDASRLASGIYLYQLQAGEYNSVKKMILIK